MRSPTLRHRLRPLALVAAVPALLVNGCAPPGEDVRISFCKEIVLTQVSDPGAVSFTRVSTNPRGPAGLTVSVAFADGAGGGEPRPRLAVCQYRHNAVDDTAQTLADPLSAYATSPESVTIDNEGLSRAALADAVRRAVGRQGQATLEGAREGVQEAVRQGQSALDQARQGVEQVIQPGGEPEPTRHGLDQAPPPGGPLEQVFRGLEQAVQPGGALDQARRGLEEAVREGGPLDQARRELEAATRPGGALDKTRQGLEQAAREGGVALERALGDLTRAVREGTTSAEQALADLRAVTRDGPNQGGGDLSAAARDGQAALERARAELEAAVKNAAGAGQASQP